ncbi:MAG: hypothetical protein ACJ8GW_06935 [Massilia sp.]
MKTASSLLAHLMGALLAFSLSGAAFACPNAAHKERVVRDPSSVAGMLYAGNFKALDAAVIHHRRADATMPDGRPTLPGFYVELTHTADGNCEASLDEAPWKELRARLEQWRSHTRDRSAPALALAILDVSEGWKARGGGFAGTVSEEGNARFQARVARGRAALEKLRAVAKIDPSWYDAMLDVGLAQGWDKEHYALLLDQAIGAYPYYFPLYFTATRYYTEKWHGSPGDMDALIEKAVAATRARQGQTMYARLHWLLDDQSSFPKNVDWPRMKTGFDDMLKDFPDNWNRNNYAHFACYANDAVAFKSQADYVKTNYIPAVWGNRRSFDICQQFADSKVAKP